MFTLRTSTPVLNALFGNRETKRWAAMLRDLEGKFSTSQVRTALLTCIAEGTIVQIGRGLYARA